MNGFSASNGAYIKRVGGEDQYLEVSAPGTYEYLRKTAEDALREFFRAEEDERLARWRWPENPDYVVYPGNVVMREAQVVHEVTGCWGQWAEREAYRDAGRDKLAAAAIAYFDAHPEPKPWQDAKPGQTWVLTVSGVGMSLTVDSHGEFQGLITLSPHSASITAGRRIYPEESSDE